MAVGSQINIEGCGNGAAGTIFYRNDSRLLINNGDKQTDKFTLIKTPPPQDPLVIDPFAEPDQTTDQPQLPSVIAKSLVVWGRAEVLLMSET